MIIKKAYKFRLYPTSATKSLLNRTFGCVRFVKNKMLESIKNSGERPTEAMLKKEYPFLKETDSIALQQGRIDLQNAFKNFKEKRAKFPKFRSKKSRQSFRTVETNGNIKIDFTKHTLKLPKISPIKFRDEREFSGDIRQVTVSKTPTGQYHASILIEENIFPKEVKEIKKIKALDMASGQFYVDDENQSPTNPKYYRKYENKLAKAQKALAKKRLKSKNRNKQRIRVSKIHEKIVSSRRDFLHKLSTQITNEYDAICVEDLNIKGMSRGLHLAKSILDNAWSTFVRFLEYKCEWKGKILLKADRFFPSSKLCNICDFKNDSLTLNDKDWVCPSCRTYHNRNHNAALNLKKYLINTLGTRGIKACGDCVRPLPLPRPSVMVQASVYEAGSLAL